MIRPMKQTLLPHLQFLYGEAKAADVYPRLKKIVTSYRDRLSSAPAKTATFFREKDAILITYGDMVQAPGERPLRTLNDFLSERIGDAINTVHLLPFFPYSSDDGFSVIDYRQVDSRLGDWSDVEAFKHSFRLMFDAVVNHVSAQSCWFKGFLRGEDPYTDYFIVVPPDANLSQVFRPRSLPLLNEVQTAGESKFVWTTFSSDQIDLNFANPDVLLAVIDTLLFYIERGAELIRLDAIAYIWKEMGTTCIHLPETHRIIQLMRSILDIVAPQVLLVTETNVPHRDNIAYFGDGYNEAQMVYNFSLPPLTLHTFHVGNAELLSKWADQLRFPTSRVSFFNFLASHDGIGLTPARDLLAEADIRAMALRVEALGGFVSFRSNPDGSESPYELNISFIDALSEPGIEEGIDLIAGRFLASQAIMLALQGVPGIYFHSLFGSRSWLDGVKQSGQKRTINRQKLQRNTLDALLDNKESLQAQVFFPYARMIRERGAEPAFHPTGKQEIIFADPALFALWRHSPSGGRHVLCLHNVANRPVKTDISMFPFFSAQQKLVDMLSGKTFPVPNGRLAIEIPSYGVYWLRSPQDPDNTRELPPSRPR